MRYRPLFVLLIRVVGVWYVAAGGVGVASVVIATVADLATDGELWFDTFLSANLIASAVSHVLRVGIGLYLLLGGAWIVRLAIPPDRPYCPGCGYDLSFAGGSSCHECGTTLPVNTDGARMDLEHVPEDIVPPNASVAASIDAAGSAGSTPPEAPAASQAPPPPPPTNEPAPRRDGLD